MGVNAKKEEYEHVELFGKPAIYTNSRIDRETVPEGFHCYDLRGSDYDPEKPIAVEAHVVVNHAGTVLIPEPLTIPAKGRRRLNGKLNFLGECLTLEGFCKEHGISLTPDTCKFTLRPAMLEQAGLFYTLPKEQDTMLGTVGHLRIDFGGNGHEFWHTWWPRDYEKYHGSAFEMELKAVVDELREKGPLESLGAMSQYCAAHGGKIAGGLQKNYGYVVETEHYRYCLRCNPAPGDYQAYLTVFDLRVQQMNMTEKETPDQGMEMGGIKL